MASAGSYSTPGAGGPLRPAATDPVSVAAAEVLSARIAAIRMLNEAGAQITRMRAALLAESAAAYVKQENANQTGLQIGAAAPAFTNGPPAPTVPDVPLVPAAVPALVVGPPPDEAKTTAALVHSGDTTGLHSAQQRLRAEATALRAA